MVEAMTRRCVVSLLLALLAFPSAVFAHRLDEYLQATLVAIEPGDVRLQINLTPGVEVAEQVLAQIDRDRDGAISRNEAAAYAELLKRDLTFGDGRAKIELKLTASEVSRAWPNCALVRESFRWNSPRAALTSPAPTSSRSKTAIYRDERVSHQRRKTEVCRDPDHRAETQREPEHRRNRISHPRPKVAESGARS